MPWRYHVVTLTTLSYLISQIWMCGGQLEFVPCSKVGHVFRERIPYKMDSNYRDPITRNLLRLADVWLDDYKYIFHAYHNYQLVNSHLYITIRLVWNMSYVTFKFKFTCANILRFLNTAVLHIAVIQNPQTLSYTPNIVPLSTPVEPNFNYT